jgi:hypothetical protein
MEIVNAKAMPGLIPAPNQFNHGKNKKNIGGQMGRTDKKLFLICVIYFRKRK